MKLKEAALLIATLAADAGISPHEMATITVVEFACRVLVARAVKDAARTVAAEPPCPF